MAMEISSKTISYLSLSSSPADKITSTDDLLTEIMLRLPVRSVLRFKCVSKHWYFIISNPDFKLLHSRRNPNPPSALFVPVPVNTPYLDSEFIQFDIVNPVKSPFITPNIDQHVKRIDIEDSCNGLLLCSIEITGVSEDTKYYICNPTINYFASLPKLDFFENSLDYGVTLVFDPLKSPYFKIVYVCGFGETPEKRYQIGIYLSETRTCKPSYSFELGESVYMHFGSGVYWNNAVQWLSQKGFVFYFNFDDEIVHKIQTPFALSGFNHQEYTSYLFQSRDHLLLVEINHIVTHIFKIHELKKDYSSWSVKYNVDLAVISRPFPEIINFTLDVYDFSVLSLVLDEKEEDKSFLVLELPRRVVRFDLISRDVHKLHDFQVTPSQSSYGVFRRWPCVFQFVESLYNV